MLDRVLVAQQGERGGLVGAVANLTLLLEDRSHVPGVSDLRLARPGTRGAGAAPIEETAVGLGLGHSHLCAGQHLRDGLAKVIAGRLGLACRHAVAIVNPATVAQPEIAVEYHNAGHPGHARQSCKPLAEVLQHQEGQVPVGSMACQQVEVLILIGVDGEELNLLRSVLFLQLEQAGDIKVGYRAVRTEEDQNKGLVAGEPLQGAAVAAQIAKRAAVGDLVADGCRLYLFRRVDRQTTVPRNSENQEKRQSSRPGHRLFLLTGRSGFPA